MNTEYKTALAQFKSDIKLMVSIVRGDAAKSFSTSEEYHAFRKDAVHGKLRICYDNPCDSQLLRRCMHVAYSLLRGRTLEQVERTSHDKLNVYLVREYIIRYTGSEELANSFSLESGKLDYTVLLVESEVA